MLASIIVPICFVVEIDPFLANDSFLKLTFEGLLPHLLERIT